MYLRAFGRGFTQMIANFLVMNSSSSSSSGSSSSSSSSSNDNSENNKFKTYLLPFWPDSGTYVNMQLSTYKLDNFTTFKTLNAVTDNHFLRLFKTRLS